MSGRIRSVKPEWLEDELLAAASDEARVLSIALLLMADDYGHGRASIATIATGAWRFEMERDGGEKAPETLAKASRALRELVAIGFVGLYENARQRYFAIRNWRKHQKVDRPSRPRIPTPDDPESQWISELARPSRDPREEFPEARETLAIDQGSGIRDQGSTSEDLPRALASQPAPKPETPSGARHLDRFASSFGPPPSGPIAELAKRFSDARHDAGFGRWTWDGKNYGPDFERLTKLSAALDAEEGLDRAEALDAALRGFFADPKARDVRCPLTWLATDAGGYVAAGRKVATAGSLADLEAEAAAAREDYQTRLGEDGDRERKERLDKARQRLAKARSAA